MFRLSNVCQLAAIAALIVVATIGCDELVTEVNNNNVYDPTTGLACVECHGDDDLKIRQPLGQWQNSRHASADWIEANVTLNGHKLLTSTCGPVCHTSEGFKKKVGSTDKVGNIPKPSVIDCFTCHLPHTGEYGAWKMDTLRGASESIDLGNLSMFNQGHSTMCGVCHRATHIPTFTDSSMTASAGRIRLDTLGKDSSISGFIADGPHSSPQANMVIGEGAALFGASRDTTSKHQRVADSSGVCITCHFGVGRGYDFGEHTFRLVDDMTGEEYVDNCNTPNCHGTGASTIVSGSMFTGDTLDSIHQLADILRDSLRVRGILTGNDSDTTEYYDSMTVPSHAGKILFNYLFYKKDGSKGIHNVNYALQMLRSSVEQWNEIPIARMSASVTRICAGETITFSTTSTGNIVNYVWNFGDGSPEVTEAGPIDIQHTFTKSDTSCNVLLTIAGNAGVDYATVRVTIDTIPVPSCIISPNPAFVDSVITFSDVSAKGPTSWLWDFGDSTPTSTLSSDNHSYSAAGSYTVQLIVGNDCGVDTLLDTVVVQALPPVPVLGKK